MTQVFSSTSQRSNKKTEGPVSHFRQNNHFKTFISKESKKILPSKFVVSEDIRNRKDLGCHLMQLLQILQMKSQGLKEEK